MAITPADTRTTITAGLRKATPATGVLTKINLPRHSIKIVTVFTNYMHDPNMRADYQSGQSN